MCFFLRAFCVYSCFRWVLTDRQPSIWWFKVVVYFLWFCFFLRGEERRRRCIDDNHNHNYSLAHIRYKVYLGVLAMVVVYLLWLYFVCSHYVRPEEISKGKASERICLRQFLLDNLSITFHILLISTPRIAPVGGTIIEVTFHSSTTRVVCKPICVGPNSNSTIVVVCNRTCRDYKVFFLKKR
jgi:hypothetical protein